MTIATVSAAQQLGTNQPTRPSRGRGCYIVDALATFDRSLPFTIIDADTGDVLIPDNVELTHDGHVRISSILGREFDDAEDAQ